MSSRHDRPHTFACCRNEYPPPSSILIILLVKAGQKETFHVKALDAMVSGRFRESVLLYETILRYDGLDLLALKCSMDLYAILGYVYYFDSIIIIIIIIIIIVVVESTQEERLFYRYDISTYIYIKFLL